MIVILGWKNRVVHHYSSWFSIRLVISNAFFAIFVQPNSVNLGFPRMAFIVRKYPTPATLLGRMRQRVCGKRFLFFFIMSSPKRFYSKQGFLQNKQSPIRTLMSYTDVTVPRTCVRASLNSNSKTGNKLLHSIIHYTS